jgi:hypothetical protein
MRIEVLNPHGAANLKAGFHPTAPGEYDFPDDPKYAGWLNGQVARGAVRMVAPVAGAAAEPQAPAEKPEPQADDGHSPPNPEATGPTAGSTPGEYDDGHSPPNPEAEGPTAGSLPGDAPAAANNGPTVFRDTPEPEPAPRRKHR